MTLQISLIEKCIECACVRGACCVSAYVRVYVQSEIEDWLVCEICIR